MDVNSLLESADKLLLEKRGKPSRLPPAAPAVDAFNKSALSSAPAQAVSRVTWSTSHALGLCDSHREFKRSTAPPQPPKHLKRRFVGVPPPAPPLRASQLPPTLRDRMDQHKLPNEVLHHRLRSYMKVSGLDIKVRVGGKVVSNAALSRDGIRTLRRKQRFTSAELSSESDDASSISYESSSSSEAPSSGSEASTAAAPVANATPRSRLGGAARWSTLMKKATVNRSSLTQESNNVTQLIHSLFR